MYIFFNYERIWWWNDTKIINRANSFFLPIGRTFRTKPFSFWFDCESNTCKMKPLDRALKQKNRKFSIVIWRTRYETVIYIRIVASDHFSIWHLMTEAICWFIRVNRHVQDIRMTKIFRWWRCCSSVFLWGLFPALGFFCYVIQSKKIMYMIKKISS